jgi:aldose 1-epimerase
MGAFSTDSRGLPIGPLTACDGLASGEPVPVQAWRGTDRCYLGWLDQTAQIHWPKQGCTMQLTADGAFKHVHVFVPAGRDVLCVEPVSHFPDAVNRPHLGPNAGMTVLEPHASLQASMTLSAGSTG